MTAGFPLTGGPPRRLGIWPPGFATLPALLEGGRRRRSMPAWCDVVERSDPLGFSGLVPHSIHKHAARMGQLPEKLASVAAFDTVSAAPPDHGGPALSVPVDLARLSLRGNAWSVRC